MDKNELKRRLIVSSTIPVLIVILMWSVKITEFLFNFSLVEYGVKPLEVSGLKGIMFSPLIHANINHLYANTFSMLILTYFLFFFYKEVAYKVFFLNWLFSGSLLWLIGRPAYHIGASGLVYSLVAFIIFSGFIRQHKSLLALSFLSVFLYGSMFWGILPIERRVSWEAHLSGMIIGIFFAYYFRKIGLQKEVLVEEEDNDNEIQEQVEVIQDEKEIEHIPDNLNSTEGDILKIQYNFIDKKKSKKNTPNTKK